MFQADEPIAVAALGWARVLKAGRPNCRGVACCISAAPAGEQALSTASLAETVARLPAITARVPLCEEERKSWTCEDLWIGRWMWTDCLEGVKITSSISVGEAQGLRGRRTAEHGSRHLAASTSPLQKIRERLGCS
jgi:hypothetical protein